MLGNPSINFSLNTILYSQFAEKVSQTAYFRPSVHGRKTMDNISLIKEGRYTGIILYPDFVVFCIFWHKTIQPSDTLYGGYISFILQKKGYIPNCYKYPQCFQPENPEICKKWVYFTIPTYMQQVAHREVLLVDHD